MESEGYTNNEFLKTLRETNYDVALEDIKMVRSTYYTSTLSGQVFEKERLETYITQYRAKSNTYINEFGETEYARAGVYFHPLYLSEEEIEALSSYVIWGDIHDLQFEDIIVVLDKSDHYGLEFCPKLTDAPYIVFDNAELFKISEDYTLSWNKYLNRYYTRNPEGEINKYNIKAILSISDDKKDELEIPIKDYPRIAIFHEKYISEMPNLIFDTVSYKLENKNDALLLQTQLEKIIKEYSVEEMYTINNIALEILNNQSVVFILEMLLYPVFALLFLMALINVYFVLYGNMYFKINDISILKSLGIKKKQLKNMFWLEYMESYLNACFYTVILFVPFAFIQSKLMIFDVLDFSGNILGSGIMAIFIFGPLLLVPLILIHMFYLNKIPILPNRMNEL